MACPSCGCKVHYQHNSDDDFAGDDERLERCAACGAVFDIEDSADEDDEHEESSAGTHGVLASAGETFGEQAPGGNAT